MKKSFIVIENKYVKSLPASCRHSFVVKKVELVVGRPLSRIYLALSHVTMNISRDFGWLSWIESGRFRPLRYFAPSGLKKCFKIRCKELYYIFLIFVLLHLFQIRYVRNFYCINLKHNFLVFYFIFVYCKGNVTWYVQF